MGLFWTKSSRASARRRPPFPASSPGFSEIDDDFYDELEESLILADLGVDTHHQGHGRHSASRGQAPEPPQDHRGGPHRLAGGPLPRCSSVGDTALNLSTQSLGGAGHRRQRRGEDHHHRQDCPPAPGARARRSCSCAADTFRAAAADQLEIWAGRAGVDIIRQGEGADPASVVYDAIARRQGPGDPT